MTLHGSFTIDPTHSRIGFAVRHAMVTTVRGSFDTFDGTAQIDSGDAAGSSVAVRIDAGSISTGNADRDQHLVSPDFFDVATYPDITFTSTRIANTGDTWSITGDLTIKDVTRSVTIDFEHLGTATDPFGNARAGFEGSTTISRQEWGLTWNAALETGGVLVSDKVTLTFDISAVRNDG